MNITLIGIFLFITVQLIIGFIVSRKVRTEDDYLLAGRSLGIPLATFSIFATWFGAESCIGSAGIAFEQGLGGVSSDPFGYGLCILIVGLFFAKKFWNLKLTTIADFLKIQYSHRTARLCALLMIPTSFLWTAAQVRAFGTVLSSVSSFDLTVAIIIATSIVIIYTTFGGMLADVITDVIQGSILIIGLSVLFYYSIYAVGGFDPFIEKISTTLTLSSEKPSPSFWLTAEHWLIPICGSVFAQELISRVLSSHSASIAQRSSFFAGTLYITIGIIPLLLGILGSSLLPELSNSENILPALAERFLPTTLFILFSGAIIAAILSTVDSSLLAISALITHNVFPASKNLPESERITVDRSIVVVAGIASSFLAISAEGVYGLVKDASAFGSSGIFVVIVGGMYFHIRNEYAAIASLLGGAISWIIAYYFFAFELSYIFSLCVSCALFFIIHFSAKTNHRTSDI